MAPPGGSKAGRAVQSHGFLGDRPRCSLAKVKSGPSLARGGAEAQPLSLSPCLLDGREELVLLGEPSSLHALPFLPSKGAFRGTDSIFRPCQSLRPTVVWRPGGLASGGPSLDIRPWNCEVEGRRCLQGPGGLCCSEPGSLWMNGASVHKGLGSLQGPAQFLPGKSSGLGLHPWAWVQLG